MTSLDVHAAVASVWKQESARVVGALTRIVRDLGVAEELAQDALVAALEQWPATGVPDRPGAWLMTTAKHRALNAIKRAKMMTHKHEALGQELAERVSAEQLEDAFGKFDFDAMRDELGDEVLRLVFTACHPVLPREARVALTLRLVGGLSTAEIARAFLVAETAIGQRIVRAKRALADAGVPFEVPCGDELAPRLASVLEVIYLVFNEGYAATAGDDLMRPALMTESVRLAGLLAQIAPDEPEVHGLSALVQLQASRVPARVDAAGDPVLLLDQDRTRWDASLIAGGLAALARAGALAPPPGPYQLQAAIAACHARATVAADTDWTQIAALYGALARQTPSPVVELNRAIAVARADGPAAGLALLDALASAPSLAGYHLLPAARAELLEQLGRDAEARDEFERAAGLADNARQRDRLLARAQRQGG